MKFTKITATGLAAALSLVLTPAMGFAGGAVLVTVEKENLVVIGDADNNHVVIDNTLDSSIFEISSGDGTTTINGSLLPFTIESTADRDFDIELGAGNDTLELLDGVSITKSFKYLGGDGDDTITLGDVFVGRRSKLKLGDGANTFTCTACNLAQKLKLQSGNDVLTVDINNSDLQGGINSGKANDLISVTNSGGGIGNLKIKTKDGEDTVVVTDVLYERKVLINTGRDDDHVTIGGIQANKKITVNGSTDSDTLVDNGGHPIVQPENTNFEF
jgi:hypothetical protein